LFVRLHSPPFPLISRCCLGICAERSRARRFCAFIGANRRPLTASTNADGFLGKDPEQHVNRAILSLATKTSWQVKDSDKWESHTEWHRIVVWDKLSEAVEPLAKGDYVLVAGQLRSSLYHEEVGIGVDTVSVPIT
jgi:hypothetical protein